MACFKFRYALLEAVYPVICLLAVGLDVDVKLLEAGSDVLDGQSEAEDGVAVFAIAIAHGANAHGADCYGSPEDGGKHLNHGLGVVAYLVRLSVLRSGATPSETGCTGEGDWAGSDQLRASSGDLQYECSDGGLHALKKLYESCSRLPDA